MPTRRKLLSQLVLSGGVLAVREALGKASQPSTKVSFDVPPHSCDCHTHIFGDPKDFPLSPKRTYTPETALPEEMSTLHKALGVERVVIVTPSIYGTDNSSTLHGIKARGKTARGVAVIDDQTSERDLDAMEKAGVCGVRINAATAGINSPDAIRTSFRSLAARLKPRGWHIQMYTNLPVIAALQEMLVNSPVVTVIDHFGGAKASLGVEQEGFPKLIDLVRSGKVYVKISAPYQNSEQAPDYPDMVPFAKALIAANPDRILWGSNWPHPNPGSGDPLKVITPLRPIDDGRVLNQLSVWAPDAVIRRKILVDNPARVYRF
ncbi:MAG TPA: amidohydrolase family protein [Bryobacteraceae bacterium]|nr:amidohydrolase family protein [Bryobacteraceae bacterium]